MTRAGSVLVVTLVALGTAGILLMTSSALARVRLQRAEQVLSGALMQIALADAALEALHTLAASPGETEAGQEGLPLEERAYRRPDGLAIRVHIRDGNRYFDLNNLTATGALTRPVAAVVTDLLRACAHPTPEAHVAAMQAWLDAPDAADNNEGPGATVRPFYSLAEWVQVPGYVSFDPADFDPRPAPLDETFIMTPGTRAAPVPVNVNTAPEHVLMAVAGGDLSAEMRELRAWREREPITSMEMILQQRGMARLRQIEPYLAVESSHFEILVHGRRPDGSEERLWVAAGRQPGGPLEVWRWIYGPLDYGERP